MDNDFLGKVFGAVFVFGCSVLLIALPTMWIVNAIFTPEALTMALGTPEIGFWPALGLACIFRGV